MNRREFLWTAGASATVPSISSASLDIEFDPDRSGQEILDRLVSWATQLATLGVSKAQTTLVESANVIAPIYRQAPDLQLRNLGHIGDGQTILVNSHQAIQSIVETLNTRLGINIPWLRIGAGFSKACSVGGIILSIAAIGNAAVPLSRANTKQGLAPANIGVDAYWNYVFALIGLGIELAFIAVPVSYRFAWRGTRFVSAKMLFRVRKFLPNAYRDGITALVMIVLHWIQRLGVELTFANLQTVTSTVRAGANQLQRLGRELAVDERVEGITPQTGGLWDVDERGLRDAMVALLQDYPTMGNLAGQELMNAVQSTPSG